jgi:hypothetical protein
VDAINDGNVLPFRIDFVDTIKMPDYINDKKVYSIDREKALADPLFVKVVVVLNFSVRYLFLISEYSINLCCITSVIKIRTI